MLEALDRYSLAAKRPVTLPLVREALEQKTVIRGSLATG